MRLANIDGRAVILLGDGRVDIGDESNGEFGPAMQEVLNRWDDFLLWCGVAKEKWASAGPPGPFDAVITDPRQVFAVGLNYRAHALESGLPIPEVPLVFTKFSSSIAPPRGELELPTAEVDWEVEVAVVIGRAARRIDARDAWRHVAGITAAQDYSARDVQMAGGSKPQFSLGKSFSGFTPLGPVLVTPDEYDDPDAIDLSCAINGEVVQSSNTADLIFSVPQIVAYLSHIVTLQPGDVILTGTPSGVGLGMTPPRYLVPGDVVTTVVAGVGELEQRCVAPAERFDAARLLG